MGLRTFLSTTVTRSARDITTTDNSDKTIPTSTSPMRHALNGSESVISSLFNVFNIRRRDNNIVQSNVHEPVTPARHGLYRFQSPKQRTKIGIEDTEVTQSSHVQPSESTPCSASSSALTAIESESPTLSNAETLPTTPGSEPQTLYSKHNKSFDHQLSKTVQSTELDAAMANMRAAETLLYQHHTAIKPQPNTGRKLKPLETILKDCSANVSSHRARSPSRLPTSAQGQVRLQTASETSAALRRRRVIKHLAFNAAAGCPNAVADIDQVNAYFAMKFRHQEASIPDLILHLDDVHVRASQLSTVECNWVARFNAVTDIATLVERRQMNPEDHEAIVTQLFPRERADMLKPEHFDIFVKGLGEEGILTRSQANAIVRLGVTVEEFDKGAHFTGPSKLARDHRHSPNALVIFEIPKQASHGAAHFSPCSTKLQRYELHYHLRILIEAAVYNQKFWKGYFFANARSKLNDFYQAYKISQEGWLLPANLTEYKRPWTYRETRLLQRGQLICDLLAKYEAGGLTDFGIMRAVRATYVQIPAQSFFSLEELESFLYHRIADSGLPATKVPEILALHPENDTAFANPRLRNCVMHNLKERARQYEKEEAERLSDIETSYTTFETVQKAQMMPWERVKARLKKALGKKEVVVPFDPFAPEHGVEGQQWCV